MAVSFYNLVPVCHSCNHVKSTEKISYSPHNKKYNTDDLLTFGYYISGIEFLADENQIGIEIMDDIVIRDNTPLYNFLKNKITHMTLSHV